MEDNTVKMNEIEEIRPVDEINEVSEDSNAGAFVAGIVGGFLAYAVVSGGKKLAAFIGSKLEARKHKEPKDGVIDVEFTDVEAEQQGSEEDNNK